MTSSIGLASYVLLLGLFAIGAWLRPPVVVAVLACLYGLKQLGEASHTWLGTHAIVTNFGVAAIAGLAATRHLMLKKAKTDRMPDAYWIILVFYAYALLSISWTPALSFALDIWGHDYPYMILLVFLAPWLSTTNSDLRTSFEWLTYAGGFLVAALLFTARWGERGLVVSSSSALDETNPLAIADLAGVVAITALFIVPAKLRTLARAGRLMIAAICAIAIVRSGSRGQLIATCATSLSVLPIAFPIRRLRSMGTALLTMAVIGGAVAWAVISYVHWWDARWIRESATSDMRGRWAMVGELLNAWSRDSISIVFGIGNSGSFSPAVAGYYPHNMPLEILGEEGLLGFGIYLALISSVLVAVVRGIRLARDDLAQRGLIAATLGCFLFTLLVSLKQGNAVSSVTFFMFAALTCRAAASVPGSQVQISAPTVAEFPPNKLQRPIQNLLR